MSDILRASIDDLRNKAYRCQEDSFELERTLHSIHQTLSDIDGIWSGDAASSFIEKIQNEEYHVKKMIKMLHELSQRLNDTCDAYNQAEEMFV